MNDNTLSTIEGPIQFVKVVEENLVEVFELLKRKKLVPAVYDQNQRRADLAGAARAVSAAGPTAC